MSTHLFSYSVFKHLKKSWYWVLWHAGPLTSIRFSQVSLHTGVLQLKYHIKYSRCVLRRNSSSLLFPLKKKKKEKKKRKAKEFYIVITESLTQNKASKYIFRIVTIIGSCICAQVWHLLIVKSAPLVTDLKSLPLNGKFSFLTEVMFSLHKKSL